ncbi:hypothetical protein ABIB40_001883 [Pedobacter sp. UYP30]|uniref:hypothetical protein n=1 Tax=Pedobacter sp. UYP30 TaxID=1756400 RepID=UPI0033967E2D
MKRLIFICCLFVILISSCTSKQQRNANEKLLVADFLNYYFTEVVKIDHPVLLKTFEKNGEWSCVTDNFKASARLGFNDMEYKTDSLDNYHLNFSPTFISLSDFPDDHSDHTWSEFREKYPKGFYVIYSPIVNEDFNKIIVKIAFGCGGRCGHDEMYIYEKASNGKWELIKKGCEGFS